MSVRALALWAALLVVPAACAARHGGPVIDTGSKPSTVSGTIAGRVLADTVALEGRKVTATDEASGMKYEATSAGNGGYTLKVPAHRKYRLDVELRAGETLKKKPDPTEVTAGDVDPDRDFVITAAR